MKSSEARKVLGLDPEDDPRAFLPAFEETITYKQELIDNAPSDEIRYRYQQELLEYEAAVKVVAGRAKLRPHTDFIITLFLIAAFSAVAWWGYGWYQEKWNAASQDEIEIARLQTEGRIAIDKRKWDAAEKSFSGIQELDPNSTIAAEGFEAIKRGKAEEKSQQMFYNLGECQAALEASRWDEATKLANLVLEADPENAAAKRKLELITQGRRRESLSKHIEALTTALDASHIANSQKALASLKQIDPTNASISDFQKRIDSLVAKRKQRHDKALALFEEASKLDTGEYSPKAMDLLSEAMRLHPENQGIRALHRKMGNYTRALRVPVDHSTIAKAIAAARPRDLIRIAAGTYKENLTISKPLRIEGSPDGKTIIELPSSQDSLIMIEKAATGTTVANLTLKHHGFDLDTQRHSAVTVEATKVSLSGLRIQGAAGHGIAVIDSASALIVGSHITGSGWDGISVYGKASIAEIRDSQCRGNLQNGISFWNGGSGAVTNSHASKNGLCGVSVMGKDSPIHLKSNTASNNRDAGILISHGANATLNLNRCENNLLSGIVIRSQGTRATLTGNITNSNHEAGILTHLGTQITEFKNNSAKGNTSQQIWRDAKLNE